MTQQPDPIEASGVPPPVPTAAPHRPRRRPRLALVLLLIPFVALLYLPFYARLTPRFAGIPFFIWYQFLWIIIGVLVTVLVYAIERVTKGTES
jgi:hypothetical protein